jgi:vancomycin resistance protein YoaR
MSNFYCGVKAVKGKRLGTAQECLKSGQIRHYGIEAIILDELMNQEEDPAEVLVKEQLKYRKLLDTAKKLVKDAKNLQLQIDIKEEDGKSTKTLEKQMNEYLKRKERLKKQLKKQKEIIDQLQKDIKKPKKKKRVTKGKNLEQAIKDILYKDLMKKIK